MYRTNVLLSIIILLYSIYGVTTLKQYCRHVNRLQSADNATFTIVGFFNINIESGSPKPNSIMRTEIMSYMIDMFNKRYGRSVIGYIMFDECGAGDHGVTTKGLLQLLLGPLPEYDIKMIEERECTCVPNTDNALDRVIGIIGPGYSSKVAQVNKLLGIRRLPMISYSSTSVELMDAEYYPHLYRTIPNDLVQERFINDLLIKFNWTYISILNSDDNYGRPGANALRKNKELCVYLQKGISYPIKDDVILPVLKKLNETTISNVIIVWGYFKVVQSILMKAAQYGVRNKTWIISESAGTRPWFVSKENLLQGDILLINQNGGNWKKFEEHFFNITYNKSRGNRWLQTFFHSHGVNNTHQTKTYLYKFKHLFNLGKVGYMRNAVQAYLNAFEQHNMKSKGCDLANSSCDPPPILNHNSFSEKFIQHITFKGLFNENVTFGQNGDIEVGHYDLYFVAKHKIEPFQKIGTWNSRKGFELNENVASSIMKTRSRCADDCTSGLYPVYDRAKKCCWICVECPKDQVKSSSGLHQCVKCPPDHLSNSNKTKCVPYIRDHLVHSTSNGYTVYAVSSISIFLILFTFITYIVERENPIVRASNLIPSLIQLIVHLILCLLPYLYFDEDTIMKCNFRCFGAGVLFTLVGGITLAKVTHISNVFKLKLRANQREVIQLYTVEIIVVITSLAFEIFLVVVVKQMKPIEMKYIDDLTTKNVYIYCDTEFHRQTQLAYYLILQVICFVKGFRERKLPEAYNETSFIAFAMFTSVLITGISIPLVDSYTNPKDQKVVLLITIMADNISLFAILYGYKVFLICKRWNLCCFPGNNVHNKTASKRSIETMKYSMDLVKKESRL